MWITLARRNRCKYESVTFSRDLVVQTPREFVSGVEYRFVACPIVGMSLLRTSADRAAMQRVEGSVESLGGRGAILAVKLRQHREPSHFPIAPIAP